jgi:hypothetical protein
VSALTRICLDSECPRQITMLAGLEHPRLCPESHVSQPIDLRPHSCDIAIFTIIEWLPSPLSATSSLVVHPGCLQQVQGPQHWQQAVGQVPRLQHRKSFPRCRHGDLLTYGPPIGRATAAMFSFATLLASTLVVMSGGTTADSLVPTAVRPTKRMPFLLEGLFGFDWETSTYFEHLVDR